MSKLMAFAASCALFLNACTGPDSTPTTASTAANIVALGDANRNLGTTFTQPPSEIGTGDGFAPQPFVNGDALTTSSA